MWYAPRYVCDIRLLYHKVQQVEAAVRYPAHAFAKTRIWCGTMCQEPMLTEKCLYLWQNFRKSGCGVNLGLRNVCKLSAKSRQPGPPGWSNICVKDVAGDQGRVILLLFR